MDRQKTLRLFYIADLAAFLLVYTSAAEAVCPACIAGAGLGAANAFAANDLYRLGFWLAGFAYLSFRYIGTRMPTRRLGAVRLILPSLCAAWPLFFFVTGAAIIAGAQDVPDLRGRGAALLFTAGSAAGTVTAFAGAVGTCALKERYRIKIPFFRISSILTILWLVSLI